MAIGDPTKPVAPKQPPAPRVAAPPPPPNPVAAPAAAIAQLFGGQAATNANIAQQQQGITLGGSQAQADLMRKQYQQQLQNTLAQYGLQSNQLGYNAAQLKAQNDQAWRQSQVDLHNLYGQRGAAGALTTQGTNYQRGLISQQLKDALQRLKIQNQQLFSSMSGLGLNRNQAQQQFQNNMAQLGLSQGQTAAQAQLAYEQAVQQANQNAINSILGFGTNLLNPAYAQAQG